MTSAPAWAGFVAVVCVPLCADATEPTHTISFHGTVVPPSLVAAACDEGVNGDSQFRGLHFAGAEQVANESVLAGFICNYVDQNGRNGLSGYVDLARPRTPSAEAIRQFVLSRGLKIYK